LGTLGGRGIPAVAELSGFDAAIVLPDAPTESTVRALTWAAFVGAGQTCVAVKRVYVVGDPEPWADALAESAQAIRVGDPSASDTDMGPLISAEARDSFDRVVRSAIEAGARLLGGGKPIPGPGWFYPPTVLLAQTSEPESRLAGCFGPIVLVRGMPDVEAAIAAANASSFGLAASVWGRNLRQARAIASRLEAGMVSVNTAVAPSAHAAAPFGGCKGSGFGRVHGSLGLREFAQPQVLHARRAGGFQPHLFPYSDRMLQLFALYRRAFHRAHKS
jgi:acyl-CoA reductase-like NAD-dependent aldehyde dehydrogenase